MGEGRLNIYVDGNTFFNTGWLARFLGLPSSYYPCGAVKDSQIAEFLSGWLACDAMAIDVRYEELVRRKADGRAIVCWVNDRNEEI